ncbi:MAG TPA: S8 family peptidase, partial [Flavisolibacter sp.]
IHVFSSGNAGTSAATTGNYAGIQQFANLTGNFKQAKNILTVGSVDSAGQLMPLSSKGPAFDGRIKPELVAYGEDGSSGAAATVSGVALLLQHLYRNLNNVLPSSSLVKSILLNSADDISNPHPDYFSGFGNLNAYRAVNTLLEDRYFEDTVLQNEIKSFSIQLPPGISKLKVTLSWNDPAALPNAGKALVNDLDIELKNNSTGETWLPWVLDHSPSIASLQSTAQRKTDTLNNNEQVTIEDPPAGMYSIEVRGSKITNNSQAFSIAWQMDTANQAYWTYPTNSDPLIASNIHWLRWETNLDGPAQLEYAINGNWNPIGAVDDVSVKYFRWQLPDTVSIAVLRMVHASGTILSDTFTISPQPEMKVGFNCADSFLLYWNKISTAYELYELEAQYLEPFMQTGDTAVLLNKSQHPSLYYSVAPLINGRRGIRSYTINYPALGPSCYINAFYLQMQTPSYAIFTVELGTLYGIAGISLEKMTATGFVVRQTITGPQDLVFQIQDDLLSQGENHYRLKLTLNNGEVIYSSIEIVYHWPLHPVVVYPNPIVQNSMLKVIANESGRYILQVFDNSGKLMWDQLLVSTITEINTGTFGKGLYIIRILDRDGKPFVQKLMVY